MINTNIDLIERIIAKIKRHGICWACTKVSECAKVDHEDSDFEFADSCVKFEEREFLKTSEFIHDCKSVYNEGYNAGYYQGREIHSKECES